MRLKKRKTHEDDGKDKAGLPGVEAERQGSAQDRLLCRFRRALTEKVESEVTREKTRRYF